MDLFSSVVSENTEYVSGCLLALSIRDVSQEKAQMVKDDSDKLAVIRKSTRMVVN